MFSFDDYKEIINAIKDKGTYSTLYEAIGKEKFIIMRHDVEYSVERARDLAEFEESMGFFSHYFFQCTNNAYNILSLKNKKILKNMHDKGHIIGLHFALNEVSDMKIIRKNIKREIDMLSDMLEFKIDTFSIHRPSTDSLKENIKLNGIINAYQDDFFTFEPNAKPESDLRVKYLSDANHIWRYGYPSRDTIFKYDRIQILTHPFAWTKKGYDNLDNYKSLVNEKYIELLDSIDNECKDFSPLRHNFSKLPVEM